MGRFETAADFYRYREPYPPAFFHTVSERLRLNRQTRLLDVGCGPGNLVLGFASFAGTCTAVDLEPAMLAATRTAAAQARLDIDFIQTAIEYLDAPPASFDFVTIGRALHWFPPEATLAVLERILAPGGYIAVCGSAAIASPLNTWTDKFKEVRTAWASAPDESRYRIDFDRWFAASRFRKYEDIAVEHRHRVTISELVGRALSFSITSPAALAESRPQFEAAMHSALAPFATADTLEEDLLAKAAIFS